MDYESSSTPALGRDVMSSVTPWSKNIDLTDRVGDHAVILALTRKSFLIADRLSLASGFSKPRYPGFARTFPSRFSPLPGQTRGLFRSVPLSTRPSARPVFERHWL